MCSTNCVDCTGPWDKDGLLKLFHEYETVFVGWLVA